LTVRARRASGARLPLAGLVASAFLHQAQLSMPHVRIVLDRMEVAPMVLGLVRLCALWVLVPGLAALVGDAALSTHYFDTRSRQPQPALERIVPRTLNGDVVYITRHEDQQLDFLRYYGLRGFAIGIGLGLLYLGGLATQLERWHDTEPETE
jgi:hypothetical protein